MEIRNHQEVKLENLLYCRKKLEEAKINDEFAAMSSFIAKNNLNQIGGVITAVHRIDRESKLLDMEIMIPVENSFEETTTYKRKSIFHLVNALHLQYKGSPNDLSKAHSEIFQYVKQEKLHPITPLYNFYSNKLEQKQSLDELVIDLLIGINPSLL